MTASPFQPETVLSPRIFEIIKYAFGCGCSILLKFLVTAFLSAFRLPLWLSYLAAQGMILLFSYFYHSKVTFSYRNDSFSAAVRKFFAFTGSVLIFKIADYVLVVLGMKWLTNHLEKNMELDFWLRQGILFLFIVFTSLRIFSVRYFWYRFLFRKPAKESVNG